MPARCLLTELHGRLRALYGERLVRLVVFGSQARGDAEAGSDIEVLVVLRGPVAPCEAIGRTIGDVAEMSLANDACEREESPLMLNVRREGVLV